MKEIMYTDDERVTLVHRRNEIIVGVDIYHEVDIRILTTCQQHIPVNRVNRWSKVEILIRSIMETQIQNLQLIQKPYKKILKQSSRSGYGLNKTISGHPRKKYILFLRPTVPAVAFTSEKFLLSQKLGVMLQLQPNAYNPLTTFTIADMIHMSANG
ncbi:carbonic anhydrase 2-like isoform X1 [Iris pallida]|uniref:Carbonic anhydrase 2-like isoform X1 n=1 Tax=Iris pallida TaxID=29817 RepID=A0AAX6EAD1_IRIPA|nr:carbonic anhydrase 2-like isoform X1 [Iris pallida]